MIYCECETPVFDPEHDSACRRCGLPVNFTPSPEEDAERRGYEAGCAAGSWVLDGNSDPEGARRILRGIEEGDPAIVDALPSAPLSGEWADSLLPRDVLAWYDLTEDDDGADDVLNAYEQGYSSGAVDTVEREAESIGFLRSITIDGWRIRTYAGIGFDSWSGKTRLGYQFGRLGENPIFTGEDFYCSPLHDPYDDETTRSLLTFLTLQKGDTDSEYFESYTAAQLEFSELYAEDVALAFGLYEEDAPSLCELATASREQVSSC